MKITVPYSEHPLADLDNWSSCEVLRNYDGVKTEPEIKTDFRLAWNAEYFFAEFVGRYKTLKLADSSVQRESSGKTCRLWELSDVCEMFIAPRDITIYREFQFAPDGRFLDIDIDGSGLKRKTDFAWESHLSLESKIKERTWMCRAKIPWHAFEKKPADGEIWHGNFYRILSHEAEERYLAWSSVLKPAFHQPKYFGEIIFRQNQ